MRNFFNFHRFNIVSCQFPFLSSEYALNRTSCLRPRISPAAWFGLIRTIDQEEQSIFRLGMHSFHFLIFHLKGTCTANICLKPPTITLSWPVSPIRGSTTTLAGASHCPVAVSPCNSSCYQSLLSLPNCRFVGWVNLTWAILAVWAASLP